MTNQLTVPYEEIENRLAICCEFLMDRKKPTEKAYESLMGKLGTKLMEYTEFEYWFKRFQNRQFDLGYDTSLDEKENSEIGSKIDKVEERSTLGYDTSQNEDTVFGIPNAIEIVNVANKVDIDLGYNTSLDEKEISEIQNTIDPKASGVEDDSEVIIEKEAPVKVRKSVRFAIDEAKETATKIDEDEPNPIVTVEKIDEYRAVIPHKIALEGHKNTDYRFDVQNVPIIFQNLINEEMCDIRQISLSSGQLGGTLEFGDFRIYWDRPSTSLCPHEEENKVGILFYEEINETIEKVDPEKSIIDHMWFVLKNPDIKLQSINISVPSNFKQLNFMFQSMFDSFNHQLCITALYFDGLNEDTFISLLKRFEPKTLGSISFNISWKEDGNYEKMKEIVELDQWKQTHTINSTGISPLTVNDVLPFKSSCLCRDRITPVDVVRVRDHFLKSPDTRRCALRNFHRPLHYYEFENALQSGNLCARMIIKNSIAYLYKFPGSKTFLKVTVSELDREIVFVNTFNCF